MGSIGRSLRCARVAVVASGSLGLLAFVGCSQVLGINSNRYLAEAGASDAATDGSQSADAADGAEDAGSLPADFQCLNDPPPPVPAGNVELRMIVNDLSGMQSSGSFLGTPIVGAIVKACGVLDFQCANALAQRITNDAGVADFMLPGGFNGFFTLIAAGYVQTLATRTTLLHDEGIQAPMLSKGTLALGEGLVQVTQDPNNAVASVTLSDCSSLPVLGATFEVTNPGPQEQIVYLQNRVPTAGLSSADSTGSALIFNVPPGSIRVSAYAPGHRLVRTMGAVTVAGSMSMLAVRPDQAKPVPLDAGVPDGGMLDGGTMPDGGASDDGGSEGGLSDGGTPEGDASDGGTMPDGGVSDGGASQ